MASGRRRKNTVLGQRARQAGVEAREIGRGFGGRIGRHGRMAGNRFRAWHASPWSAVFRFVFSVVFFAICVWALDWLALHTGMHALGVIAAFFSQNFGAFILLFMLTALLRMLMHAGRAARQLVWPVKFGLSWAVIAWIASAVIVEGRLFAGNVQVWEMAVFLNAHLLGVFAAFAALGYLGVLAGMRFYKDFECCEEGDFMATSERQSVKAKAQESRISGKRLYRSGRERILGGVCGGIAEYFDADPTLVRLVWVLLSLAWGFGILLYLIMWVITPRNPRDDWSERHTPR